MSKKEKWDSEVATYLASLAATDKTVQEGFIRDSGISPGFVSFLKVQDRSQDARRYQALMRWHLRDKQPETKKQRTSPPNKGWTRTPDRQFKNQRDASPAVQMDLDELSTNDDDVSGGALFANAPAVAHALISAELCTAPVPATVAAVCTKHHWDEPQLFTPREWQQIRQHEWDSGVPCGANKRIREKQWPRATGGGFSLLVKGSLPGKMPTSGRRNEQLKRQLARDLLATLQQKFPEAVAHPDRFKEPSLSPLQALFLMKDSHMSYNKCACVCSLW